ncbi:non-homologous end-joining DNA ligase LigD, partial [Mycolicibacterium insubricum]|uniref:non-homologous end-joining DNA ligase LigD n=1 Tax=Mycolicibacterium insubricum TaxID=444597 RepID=UPI0021F39837
KTARTGRVLVDWSQNSAAKTTVAPYALRGVDQPTVAAPRTWAARAAHRRLHPPAADRDGAARPVGCFGMHEWAMVYRSAKPRHTQLPLRLGSAGTDAVLETTGLRCSHYDAFRFFTAAAEPRNETPLSRAAQVDHEQPGCVHTNMDLAKWSLKLTPLIPAGLLLDCFELAANARVLDMRASPYDLRDLGFAPIRVEEQAGRAEYVRLQSEIADRAAVLRAALIGRCENLLAAL